MGINKKLLLISVVVFIGFRVKAQSRWSQKINFSSTAEIIGRVGTTAERVSKTAPGLVGKTAKIISTTARIMSSGSQKSGQSRNSKP